MKKVKTYSIFHHPLVAGVTVMILISAVLTAASAALVLYAVMAQDHIQTAGIVCAAAAALLGSITTAGKTKSGKLINSICSGVVFAVILLICNLFFVKNEDRNVLQVLLPILICAVVGSLLSASSKKRFKRKK